ncbi:MAG: N-6 DNA methylase [Gammaproteobacteria bacterium]|nr:N-6 DNA methylase [Rhodospirillaceae bacterium]MDE0364033.1 N-6 DNA methylase [Gammaproteobacteria bacterium]
MMDSDIDSGSYGYSKVTHHPAPSVKESGAYYTPKAVASTLVRWAVRHDDDRLLDPSCGDGSFVVAHNNVVGVERDPEAATRAKQRAPWLDLHNGDFFTWAEQTNERFDCAAGNPPFIRYQTFNGAVRKRAIALCATIGVPFSGLSSSWAPFLVATSMLLKPGGRMAFVIPAAIGHAPYAAPVIDRLASCFNAVHIVAIRRKLFPRLSEDCWLLFADGYGGSTDHLKFTPLDRFSEVRMPPCSATRIPLSEWRGTWNKRLRPYLLNSDTRSLYQAVAKRPDSKRLGLLASVGIGYVSGANKFFHLRPSQAEQLGIPESLLCATVRNGRMLPRRTLTNAIVNGWRQSDEPMLLLRIQRGTELSKNVISYLETEAARQASKRYKCRNRNPWYSVPDVRIPDFFLTYMSGRSSNLVRNLAKATCTNALHAVSLRDRRFASRLLEMWWSSYVQLSCELEGHALGGGMLKLEPREAANVVIPSPENINSFSSSVFDDAISVMHKWRHYGSS